MHKTMVRFSGLNLWGLEVALPCGRTMRFSGRHGGWNCDELCPLFGSHCNARKILCKILIGTVHVRVSTGYVWYRWIWLIVPRYSSNCHNVGASIALKPCIQLPLIAQVPVPWDLTVHFRGNSSLTKDLLPFSALIEDYRNWGWASWPAWPTWPAWHLVFNFTSPISGYEPHPHGNYQLICCEGFLSNFLWGGKCVTSDKIIWYQMMPGRAGAEVSKYMRKQWPKRMPVRCRRSQRLRLWDESTNEQMVAEMPMKWHEINDMTESVHEWLSEWKNSAATNEPINESMSEPKDEPMNESMTETMKGSTNPEVNEWVKQSNEWVVELLSECVGGWVGEWVSEWTNARTIERTNDNQSTN